LGTALLQVTSLLSPPPPLLLHNIFQFRILAQNFRIHLQNHGMLSKQQRVLLQELGVLAQHARMLAKHHYHGFRYLLLEREDIHRCVASFQCRRRACEAGIHTLPSHLGPFKSPSGRSLL
ncbi:hypothetical protein BS50DRAFT_668335, partial [Corynespora cassiicola Philippines]